MSCPFQTRLYLGWEYLLGCYCLLQLMSLMSFVSIASMTTESSFSLFGIGTLLQQGDMQTCTQSGESNYKEFEDRFRELSTYGNDHLICVIEDEDSERIVATGSVFIEKKFIRSCANVGHIEDVVVDASVRGLHLGKKIIDFLMKHAESKGCYKVILDCKEENIPFYEKCGFKPKEVQMVKYFI
ncbi:hypothetical protein Droror1_Dr00019375 [Drosera rotundifolia]